MSFAVNFKGFMGYYKLAKKEPEKAKKYFEEAYAKGLSKSGYLTAYASLLMQEQQYEKALEVFQKAYRAVDATAQLKAGIKANLSICYFKQGDKERALELAEEMYDNQRSGTSYVLYGFLLLDAGRTEEALKINLKGYEYDEEDAAICDNLGQTYYAMGDMENAEKFFQKALDEKDDMVDSLYFMAELCCKKEKYDAAREYLEAAKEVPIPALSVITKEMIQQKMDEIEPFCTKKQEDEEEDD